MYYPCDTALVEPTLNRCMNSARQYDRVALECFLARPTDIRHYPRLAVLSTYLIDLWRFVLELDGRPVQSSPRTRHHGSLHDVDSRSVRATRPRYHWLYVMYMRCLQCHTMLSAVRGGP